MSAASNGGIRPAQAFCPTPSRCMEVGCNAECRRGWLAFCLGLLSREGIQLSARET